MAVFKSTDIIIPTSKGSTTSNLRFLIILENLFCINRYYLIDSTKSKILCNFIFTCVILIISCTFIYDIYYFGDNENISIRIFQILYGFELIILAISALIFGKSFKALKRLDDKCGIDEEYLSSIQDSVSKSSVICLISSILDVCGLATLFSNPSVILVICLSIWAHDSEMLFYTIIIEAVNLKLGRMERSSLIFASKIYKHLLVAVLNLSQEFTTRVLVMLTSTLITSIIFTVVIMLVEVDTFMKLATILLWRELKSLYLLWKLCMTAAETKIICDQLGYHLTSRLALYSKDTKSMEHQIASRLMKSLMLQQPYHLDGTVLTLELSVPIDLIDLTVNYLLIIVQIYLALK